MALTINPDFARLARVFPDADADEALAMAEVAELGASRAKAVRRIKELRDARDLFLAWAVHLSEAQA